ncbi:hypothetical protein V6N11_055978 [Hibiscus sabdariffa]|uniref:Uncharacterized protein n=1 Tax=Hibiscus sabdariffa TaxID=183260 RepID=A0ABR2T351_9ROSI
MAKWVKLGFGIDLKMDGLETKGCSKGVEAVVFRESVGGKGGVCSMGFSSVMGVLERSLVVLEVFSMGVDLVRGCSRCGDDVSTRWWLRSGYRARLKLTTVL